MTPLAVTVSLQLRALVSAHQKTQKALAAEAGIHPVTFSKYLSGHRLPATEELYKIASVLGVTTSHLLAEPSSPDVPEYRSLVCKMLNLPGTATDLDLMIFGGHVDAEHQALLYLQQLKSIHGKREATIRARLKAEEAQP
jgi:transcriptional regulator with XRE-family HTH domain